MAGCHSACPRPIPWRRFYPDERYTPPAGNCGWYLVGASPASIRSCPRAHNRSFRLRVSSPIGQPPAPNPPGRATPRSDRPSWSYPPCSRADDLSDCPLSPDPRGPPLRADHLAGRRPRPPRPRGRTPQRRNRPPVPRLGASRRPRQHRGRRSRPSPRPGVRRSARASGGYGALVAGTGRRGPADGGRTGDRRTDEGARRPVRTAGHGSRHRVLSLRSHRDGRRGLRLRHAAPAAVAAPDVRPSARPDRLSHPERRRRRRAGRPWLPLAAGRGGQLVSVRGAADPAATVRRRPAP